LKELEPVKRTLVCDEFERTHSNVESVTTIEVMRVFIRPLVFIFVWDTARY